MCSSSDRRFNAIKSNLSYEILKNLARSRFLYRMAKRFIRLRFCTIPYMHFNARADFCHTNPLECSDCKIFACGKKFAHAKKLVG